jgi:hypothetical protein
MGEYSSSPILFYISIVFFAIGCIAIGSDAGTSYFGSDLAIIAIGAGFMLLFRFGAVGAQNASGETASRETIGDIPHLAQRAGTPRADH